MQEQAIVFKEQGNQYFKDKNYIQAIKMYTLAIEKDPSCSIFYSNRARCYLNMNDFDESFKDSQKAIELDEKNIKGHYIMAETLVAITDNTKDIKHLDAAIQKLKKSLTLCPSQGKSEFQEKFVDKIYKAKKKRWQIKAQEEQDKRKKVRSYLIGLVEKDQQLGDEAKDTLNERVQKLMEKNLHTQKHKTPKSLICHLTKKLYKNPICNEYGHTYSKAPYTEYLKKNDNTDPITKNKINLHISYPNINIKKAVEKFIEKNPWAYEEEFDAI